MNKLWHYSVPCHTFDMTPTTIFVWLVPYSNEPILSNVVRSPGGNCRNLRWVGSLRFICRSGTRRFHLRMSGPQMGSGVSPIERMPQWWPRRWLPWDAPRHQEVALYILSLRVHAFPVRVASPCQRSDMTLMEVSQDALDSLYIRTIWLLYIDVFFVDLIWYLCLF